MNTYVAYRCEEIGRLPKLSVYPQEPRLSSSSFFFFFFLHSKYGVPAHAGTNFRLAAGFRLGKFSIRVVFVLAHHERESNWYNCIRL